VLKEVARGGLDRGYVTVGYPQRALVPAAREGGPVTGFYEALGADTYRSFPATAGPWDSALQHAGPPCALLAHAIEHAPEVRPGLRFARFTVEMIRPVPVADLRIAVRVLRTGRRTELVEAELAEAGPTAAPGVGGRVVLRMVALRVAVADGSAPAVPDPAPPTPLPGPMPPPVWSGAHHDGYLAAIEWRFAEGVLGEPGPAIAWGRPRFDLVAGRALSPVERALLIADSASGVSAALDIRAWSFVNADLTVHLHRYPEGGWVCLEARTVLDAGGVGLARSRLCDGSGAIGHTLQTLVVTPRAGVAG
jgi:hypothetical protein